MYVVILVFMINSCYGLINIPTENELTSEGDRGMWCHKVHVEFNSDEKSNIWAKIRNNLKLKEAYLKYCANITPGSMQAAKLQAEMKLKEEDNANAAVFDHPIKEIEKWCIITKQRYGVIPGQSFGSLPPEQHERYLKAKCYRYFCEPHPRAGHGKFDCVPLKNKQKQEQESDADANTNHLRYIRTR
jgi:hypothetical protein